MSDDEILDWIKINCLNNFNIWYNLIILKINKGLVKIMSKYIEESFNFMYCIVDFPNYVKGWNNMSAAIIVTGVLVLVVGCAIGVIVLSLSKHENAVKNFLSIILPTVILAFLEIIIGCSVSSYRELWLMFKYDDVRVFDYAGDTPIEVDELTAAGYTVV